MQGQHRLLTASEVATMTGLKESTIRRLARAGKMPCRRIGKYMRFLEPDIGAWVRDSEYRTETS